MSLKPNDLMLNVIEFFGIMIPGAVFTLIHGVRILKPYGLFPEDPQTLLDWVTVFGFSYILGHFLLGFSVPLNQLAQRFPTEGTTKYFNTITNQIKLPAGTIHSRSSVFYYVFSFIRIHSSGALAELERQTGEYKLFRSLTLLFLLDLPLSALSNPMGSINIERLLFSLFLSGLAYIRFQGLYDWTSRLAFDFFLQLKLADAEAR